MSRVLKFRVWEIDDKCWGNLAYLECCGPTLTHLLYSEEPEKYIIEQCSGLKDSQGQEIYEGDFVTFQCWGNDTVLRGSVWWDSEAAAWAFGRYTHPHCGEPFDWGYSASKIKDGSIQVVGNIHEDNDSTK